VKYFAKDWSLLSSQRER